MSDNKPKRPMRSDLPGEEALAAVAEPIPAFEATQAAAEPAYASAAAFEPETAAAARPQEPALDEAWTAFAEAQAALARGFESLAAEMAGRTSSGIAATTEAAVALLGARTFAEAVEINAGLARRSFDAALEGSARLTEIGANAMAEAAKPILSRLGVATR